jgi:hypothetical protein
MVKTQEIISQTELSEKMVYDDLKKRGILNKYPDTKVKHIWNWIVASYREWNVKVYDRVINWKIEVQFNLKTTREAHYFKKASYLAWYREVEDSKWIFQMYSIKDIDIKTWNPIKWANPLDKFSLKYFKAWQDISFQEDKLGLETIKDVDTEWNFHSPTESQLKAYIETWTVRIKDVYTFLKQKQIDKNTFDKFLPSLQKLLLIQIWETRFEALWDYVTEQEIKDYYEWGYISKDLARECYKKIKERDSIKQKKEKKKKDIHSKAHLETKEIKIG